MFAKERQDRIAALLRKQGAVTTAGLVAGFGVSVETIRRDLLHMEQEGRLSRVHGGAVCKANMKPFYNLPRRSREFSRQKLALSRKAMDCICEGDIIGVDAGSTALAFAKALEERFTTLTIVTHSLEVFEILNQHEGFSVMLCGGRYMQAEKAFYGSLTLDALSSLHIPKVFIFPSSVSLTYGICDYQEEFCQVQRQLLKSADAVYILADSSKFEKTALLRIDSTRPEYTYITDDLLPEALQALYEENGIRILKGKTTR